MTISGATEKLATWSPQGIPIDEFECAAYRDLAVAAVFSVWNQYGRPTNLGEIYKFIKARIVEKVAEGTWEFTPFCRSKRTVDRRVNEASSPKFYHDGTPKIVAVTAGVYQVNPKLFLTVKR